MNTKKSNIIYSVFYEHYAKHKDIKTIEFLIFLAQKESLKKFEKPLLNEKIHIYEDKVKIPYISDLLRVGEKQYISYRGYDITQMRKYLKLLKKYKDYTDQAIEEEVKKNITENILSDKYFVYSDYCNKNYRRYARLIMNQENHACLSFIRKILITIIIAILVIILMGIYFIYFASGQVNLTIQNLLFIMLIDFCLITIYVYWTLLWMKPTEFEIKNGYFKNELK